MGGIQNNGQDLDRGIINNIHIKNGCLKEVLTIAIFQIKSPFFDELSAVGKNECVFDVTSETRNKFLQRETKIKKILEQMETLNNERKVKIDIIVFPEYCFPSNIKDSIKNFVDKFELTLKSLNQFYLLSKTFVSLNNSIWSMYRSI